MIHNHVYFHNVAELRTSGNEGALQLCRIPETLRLQLHEFALDSALKTGAVELRFHLVSDRVKIKLQVLNAEALMDGFAVAQVYHGTFQETAPRIMGAGVTEITVERPSELERMNQIAAEEGLAYAPDLVRILLPYETHIAFIGIEGETVPPRDGSMPERRMLVYGSSISNGASAVRPSGLYSVRAAEKLGMEVRSLALAGGAMLDQAMAEYMAEQTDWDIAVLELGINMIWDVKAGRPGSPDEFRERVDAFISIVTAAHPDKWIFVTDLFSYKGDVKDGELGFEFRSIVAYKVEQMRLPRLIHIPGRELLPRTSLLTSDLIHPSEEGQLVVSDNLANIVSRYIKS
ncbi:SGNH/GDSL hydrolase family protein [Paenibacillus sp. YIM B09110]|uniref:SGNH/GDSL hydrolase family protein n=1 Tax=Paenibacillus sp. YIM B09110 TaxID=3126102 RepID=UPI00301B88AA